MEFLAAAAVKDVLFTCVKAPNLDLASLLSILDKHRNVKDGNGKVKTLEACVEEELQDPPGTTTKKEDSSSGEKPSDDADATKPAAMQNGSNSMAPINGSNGAVAKPPAAVVRRIVTALRQMVDDLAQGNLGTLNLAAEVTSRP